MVYLDLVLNLSLLVAISVVSVFVEKRWPRDNRWGALMQGVLFGGAAVIGMLRPLNLGPGLIFDGRSVMVSLCAFYFGPLAAVPAILLTVICRVILAGSGMWTGIAVIVSTTAAGLAARQIWKPERVPPDAVRLYFFGVVVHLVMLGMMFTLPTSMVWNVFREVGPPILLLYPLATVLAGKILSDQIVTLQHIESLHRASQYLDVTLQSIGDALISTDASGRVRMMNPVAESLTGWSREEAVGLPLSQIFPIVHAETGEEVKNPVEQVLARGVVVGLGNHTTLIARDGTRRQISDSAAPIVDKNQEIIGVVLVFRDVTREYRMRQDLVQSERDYRNLFDHHSAIKLIIEPETGAIVRANHAAAGFYGWSREELSRMRIQDINILSPDQVKAEIEKARNLSRIHFEFRHRLADGSIRDVEVFSSRISLKAKEYLHSIIHDVTDRKRIEEKQKAGEERLKAILEAAADPIVLYDVNGCPLFINPAFTEVFGWTMEELQGRRIPFVPQDQQEPTHLKIQQMMESGSPVRMETRRLTKSGNIIEMLVSASPVLDPDGCPSGFVACLTDVTRIRDMEKRIREAQKMEAIGLLAGGIAHDFNNILFPITGLTQMLLWDTPQESPGYENLIRISEATRRATDLVKQILVFSRQSDNRKIPVDLQVVVGETFQLARSSIPTNIGMDLKMPENRIRVMADPTRIHQVLMNLITNAFHAVEKTGGSIRVGLSETDWDGQNPEKGKTSFGPGRYARLCVADTGHGIDPGLMDKIFDPYFTTKPQGKGTGLGLAVVHGIVLESGGDIRVESRPGEGTIFTVMLPIPQESEPAETVMDSGPIPTGKGRILVIDDEPSIVNMEKQVLERLGYQVEGLVDSRMALEQVRKDPYRCDLVITDMAMPGMTGADMARRMLSVRPDLPILLCTGYSEDMDAEKARSLGIQGFVEKPVMPRELAEKIREILGGSG